MLPSNLYPPNSQDVIILTGSIDVLTQFRYISESDNLGSTDSEVKKILTLHLPISEYDTLGSDSEGDGRATSQELMSFNQRMRGEC